MVKPKQAGKPGYPTGDCILQQGRGEIREGEGEKLNLLFKNGTK